MYVYMLLQVIIIVIKIKLLNILIKRKHKTCKWHPATFLNNWNEFHKVKHLNVLGEYIRVVQNSAEDNPEIIQNVFCSAMNLFGICRDINETHIERVKKIMNMF